jgi:hypothetical protein
MPHYPVLQPNGKLSVWSAIVDNFTSFDNSVTDAADEISRWHAGNVIKYCQAVSDGRKPFDFWGDWIDNVAFALFLHGDSDEACQMALEMCKPYQRRTINVLVDLHKLEKELDDVTFNLRSQLDAIPIAAIVRYWRNSNYDVRRANANECTTEMFDDDDALIEDWVNAMEGASQ